MYVLSANWFFKVVYGIAKPFLNERTKSKIKIISKMSELLTYFDKNQLFKEYGGSCDYVYSYPC